jgi:hypothetical protein
LNAHFLGNGQVFLLGNFFGGNVPIIPFKQTTNQVLPTWVPRSEIILANSPRSICSRRLQIAQNNLPIKIAILWDNIAMLLAREHPV